MSTAAEPAVVCVGLATLDTIFAVPHAPVPGGRAVASELVTAGGGPAATAAVTLARLGVPVAFVGAVGDDEVGATVRRGLADEGVDVSELALVRGARSPRSSILVDGRTAERTIVHYAGDVPPLALSPHARERCRAAQWVHVDHAGYAAAPRDARLSVDGGNPIPGLDLSHVALYAPTAAALRAAFGDPAAAIAAGAETVVVTDGAAGCSAHLRDGSVVRAAAFDVDAVSTLGAGDVFHGALLAQLVRGESVADALRLANLVAALSCRALDGRSAIPTAAELEALAVGAGNGG
ncbi:MAG TPA: PfkB family carbohydrate kinase [Gaiellaceae bacterium]|nr:PfkB family carbohydrate kinase [Gaiellaceae bacterium]